MPRARAPAVSVVIPTRDRPALLARALASVERQDEDVEVVVVDDGDGSGAHLARQVRAGRLTTLLSGRAGQVDARILGVGAATGERIAFLDDDDWWDEPTHLAAMRAAAGPGPALVFASGAIVPEGPHAGPGTLLPFEAAADARGIRRDNRLLVSGVVYDRALHARLGPFDRDLPFYWDWDWYLRLFAAGVPFVASTSRAVRISARGDSVSAAANAAARRADLDRLTSKHGLGRLRPRNHEQIAREGNRPSDPDPDDADPAGPAAGARFHGSATGSLPTISAPPRNQGS